MLDTREHLIISDFPPMKRGQLTTLQVNLGYRCNLSCSHCHVNAGPTRTEMMDRGNIERVLQVLDARDISTLDLTGGAPELHHDFRYLVEEACKMGVEVIDRCNLTVLFEPGQEGLTRFLAEQGVTIVASLPCYLESNVDGQRGKGTYGKSIEALQLLNSLGYGAEGSKQLNLVYNPTGPNLPPPQGALEADYKRELGERFGITFNQLFTITNMPISRFGAVLLSRGQYAEYMQLLRDSFSEANLETVMCRNLVSVDWQGNLYDCDFNQMLSMPLAGRHSRHLKDLLNESLEGVSIVVGEHCYGCTAGQGSSCGGALGE